MEGKVEKLNVALSVLDDCSKVWDKATNSFVKDPANECVKFNSGEGCETYISQWGNCMPKNYEGSDKNIYMTHIKDELPGPWKCMDCEDELCPGGCREFKDCKGRLLTNEPSVDGTATHNRKCRNLTTCKSNEYEVSPPVREEGYEYYVADRKCARVKDCASDEFEIKGPTAYANRVCKKLTSCTSEEWSREPQKDPTGKRYIKDNYCRPKKSCNGQFVEDHGGPREDRKCKIGDFACPLGFFQSTPPRKGCTKRPSCQIYDKWRKKGHGSQYNLPLSPSLPHGSRTETWGDCLRYCIQNRECMQVVFNKKSRYCYPMINAGSDDVDGRGGSNHDWISAYCDFRQPWETDPEHTCEVENCTTYLSPTKQCGAQYKDQAIWDCTKCDTQKYYAVNPECKTFSTCENRLFKVRATDNGKSKKDHECEDVKTCKFQEYEVSPPMKSFGEKHEGMVCSGRDAEPIWQGYIGKEKCRRVCGTNEECSAFSTYGDLCVTYKKCPVLEKNTCECESSTDCTDRLKPKDKQKNRQYDFDKNVHTCFLKEKGKCPLYVVPREDEVQHNTPGVGTWGGVCACPNGDVYPVGRIKPKCACKEAWTHKGTTYYGCDSRAPGHTTTWCRTDANCDSTTGWKECTKKEEEKGKDQCDELACVGGTAGRCSKSIVSPGTKVTCSLKNWIRFKEKDWNTCDRGEYKRDGKCVPIKPYKHFGWAVAFVQESQPVLAKGKKTWMDCNAGALHHSPETYKKENNYIENRQCAPLATCNGEFVMKEVLIDGTAKENRKCLPPSACTPEKEKSGMRIVRAEYGINNETQYSSKRSPAMKPLTINQAFFQKKMDNDITSIVAKECDGKQTCTFELEADKIKDLNPEINKSAIVFYTCDDDKWHSSTGNQCSETSIERMRSDPGVLYADRVAERLGLDDDDDKYRKKKDSVPLLKNLYDYWFGTFQYGSPDGKKLGCKTYSIQSNITYFNAAGEKHKDHQQTSTGKSFHLSCGPPKYFAGQYIKERQALLPPSSKCPVKCQRSNCLRYKKKDDVCGKPFKKNPPNSACRKPPSGWKKATKQSDGTYGSGNYYPVDGKINDIEQCKKICIDDEQCKAVLFQHQYMKPMTDYCKTGTFTHIEVPAVESRAACNQLCMERETCSVGAYTHSQKLCVLYDGECAGSGVETPAHWGAMFSRKTSDLCQVYRECPRVGKSGWAKDFDLYSKDYETNCTKCTMTDLFLPATKDVNCATMTSCKAGVTRDFHGFRTFTGRAVDDMPTDGTAPRDRICEEGKKLSKKCKDTQSCGLVQRPTLSHDFSQDHKEFSANKTKCDFNRGCDDGMQLSCYKSKHPRADIDKTVSTLKNVLSYTSDEGDKKRRLDMINRLEEIRDGDTVCSYPEPYFSVQKNIFVDTYAPELKVSDRPFNYDTYRKYIAHKPKSYERRYLHKISSQEGFKMDRAWGVTQYLANYHYEMLDDNIGYNTYKKDSFGRFILNPMSDNTVRRQSTLYDLIRDTNECAFDNNQHDDPSSLAENLGCPPEFPYRGNKLTTDISYGGDRLSNNRTYASVQERYDEPERLKNSGPQIDDLSSKHKGRFCFRHKACTTNQCFDKLKEESDRIEKGCNVPLLVPTYDPILVDGGTQIGLFSDWDKQYGLINSSAYDYDDYPFKNMNLWKLSNDITKKGGLLEKAGLKLDEVVAIRNDFAAGHDRLLIAYKAGNKTISDPRWAYNSAEYQRDLRFNLKFIKRPGCRETVDRINKGDTCGAVRRFTPGTATYEYSGKQDKTVEGAACRQNYTFDSKGECNGEAYVQMYKNTTDNPGKTYDQLVEACADACLSKKTPIDGQTWSAFGEAGGFIVRASGRCWCEKKTDNCSKKSSVYDRYLFAPPSCKAMEGGRVNWSGRNVGKRIDEKDWVDDADCTAFATEKQARYYQKASGKCHVYDKATTSTNQCGEHCFKVPTPLVVAHNAFYEQIKGMRACKTDLNENECKSLPQFQQTGRYPGFAAGCIRSQTGLVFWNALSKCTQKPSTKSSTKSNFKDGYFHSNKCTDPDGTGQPWCYTTGEKRWGYCWTEGDTVSKNGPCQRWDCNVNDPKVGECGHTSGSGQHFHCLCKEVESLIGCPVDGAKKWSFCRPLLSEAGEEGVSAENLDAVEWCPYRYKTHHVDHLEKDRPKNERGCPASHPWVKQWGEKDKCFKRPFCAVSMQCAQSVGGQSGTTCDGIDIRTNCACKGTGPEGTCDFHGFNYRWCRTKDDQNRCGPNDDMGTDKNWNFCQLRDGCPETHPFRTTLAKDAPDYDLCFTKKVCARIDPANPGQPICKYKGYERVPGKQCEVPAGGWKENVNRNSYEKGEAECKKACTDDPDCDAFSHKYKSLGTKYCTSTKTSHADMDAYTKEECQAKCDESPTCAAFSHNRNTNKCTTYDGTCTVSSDDIPSSWASGWEFWVNECQNYRLCTLEDGTESALFKRNDDIDFRRDTKPRDWSPENTDDEIVLTVEVPCKNVSPTTAYESIADFEECLKAKNQFLGQVKGGIAFDAIGKEHRRSSRDGSSWQLYNEPPRQSFSLVKIEDETLPKGCIYVHQQNPDDSFGGWMFNSTGQGTENPIVFGTAATNVEDKDNAGIVYSALPSYCAPGEPCTVGIVCKKSPDSPAPTPTSGST
jgi:hypothetical protein